MDSQEFQETIRDLKWWHAQYPATQSIKVELLKKSEQWLGPAALVVHVGFVCLACNKKFKTHGTGQSTWKKQQVPGARTAWAHSQGARHVKNHATWKQKQVIVCMIRYYCMHAYTLINANMQFCLFVYDNACQVCIQVDDVAKEIPTKRHCDTLAEGFPPKKRPTTATEKEQLSANKALQTLIRLADSGIRPQIPRNLPPSQRTGKCARIVPPEIKLTQLESLLQKYPGDISRVDRTSGRLHCRCGMSWATNLANLERMYTLHVNGKVCAHRRRGMQTYAVPLLGRCNSRKASPSSKDTRS